MNELFGNVRVPSLNNTEKIQKWINNVKWDWFCNIVPTKTLPVELKGKMNYFFSQLKKNSKILLAGFGVGLSMGATIINW